MQIQSPVFKQSYLVADHEKVVDAACPIDGTPLIWVNEPSMSRYSCKACGASYHIGDISFQALKVQAREHASRLEEELDEGMVLPKDEARTKAILDAARKTVLFN